MNNIDINNLTGKCLVAMPETEGEFAKAVVYICSHDKNGAMGFVINKIFRDVSFSDLALELPEEVRNSVAMINLHSGGPLEKNKGFILHSADYKSEDSYTPLGGLVAISSSIETLVDIAAGRGPLQKLVVLGYTGWAPQQLEAEIAANLWLVADTATELVFNTDDDAKWPLALSSLGIIHNNLAPTYGHS